MNHRVALLLVTCFAVLFGGCTTEGPIVIDEQASAPPLQAGVGTRTDTVTAPIPTQPSSPLPNAAPTTPARFWVQVGAFKEVQRATDVQNLARQRFAYSVVNDFDGVLGMYRIRIGSFDSHDAADAFRQTMQKQYPAEYKDAWVVVSGTGQQ